MLNQLFLGLVVASATLGTTLATSARAEAAAGYQLMPVTGMVLGSALNSAGQVAGTDRYREALLWQSGAGQSLGLPALYELDSASRLGLSENGQIATYHEASDASVRWQAGAYTELRAPYQSGLKTMAYGVNDAGWVVGMTRYPGGGFEYPSTAATLWDANGLGSELGDLGGLNSAAFAINNQGVVVGWGVDAATGARAVSWFNGVPTVLASLSATPWDAANSISESGLIVGRAQTTAGQTHAALWLADWVFDLGTLPGGEHSIALDVNRWGQTVGTSTSDQGLSHAVLWDNFQAIDLNLYLGADERLAGWHLGSAASINDGGAILVNGFNLVTHEGQAFLLTPVPEPGTWALWLAGLAGVALAKARRVGTRSVL